MSDGTALDWRHDPILLRIVVGLLGTVVLVVTVSTVVLSALHVDTPPAVTHIGSTALGSLGGLLAFVLTGTTPRLPEQETKP